MSRYESSAVTPACIVCGWHIVGVMYYVNDTGPLCDKCHDANETKVADDAR